MDQWAVEWLKIPGRFMRLHAYKAGSWGTIQRTQVRPSLPARLHFWHYFRVLPQNVLSDCNGNLVLLSYSCSCVWAQLVQPCSFPGCNWAASSLAGATGSVQLGCCRPGLKLKGVEGATPLRPPGPPVWSPLAVFRRHPSCLEGLSFF